MLNAVYHYLLDVDANNAVEPRLATSWKVSKDGLRYTFHLAPNPTWHDGSPVPCETVDDAPHPLRTGRVTACQDAMGT